MSSYFEKNKSLYYDNLTLVRTKNDLKQWLKYFLVGVAETADQAIHTLAAVIALKQKLETEINVQFGKKINKSHLLLQHLFVKPVIYVKQVQTITKISYKSANELVTDFVNAGILVETTGQSRNRMFIFQEYIQLFYDHEK